MKVLRPMSPDDHKKFSWVCQHGGRRLPQSPAARIATLIEWLHGVPIMDSEGNWTGERTAPLISKADFIRLADLPVDRQISSKHRNVRTMEVTAQDGESAAPLRADGMPVGRPFEPGNRLNPGGMTKYEREIRDAIQNQEPAEEVCKVIAAMKVQALAGTKASPAAAKVYLSYTAGETRHLPDERVAKLVEQKMQDLLDEAEARAAAKGAA